MRAGPGPVIPADIFHDEREDRRVARLQLRPAARSRSVPSVGVVIALHRLRPVLFVVCLPVEIGTVTLNGLY